MNIDIAAYHRWLKQWRCFIGVHNGGANTGFISSPPFYFISYRAVCEACGQEYWRSRP